LTWPDRAWLALLARTVPAERLAAMRLIVIPGTILRWQRDIVRRRWARVSRRGRSGRWPMHRTVRSVVLRLARENESWGYRRIHGELAGLGITVAPSTVWQILKDAGISPAPRRDGPGWVKFLRSQAQRILALDFFTADLLNGTKVYVLAVIEHGTRRIRVLGATEHPVQSWVVQQGPGPVHGPGRCRRERDVRPAPGRQLRSRVRRRLPGRWRQGRPLRYPCAPDERVCGKVRAHRPGPRSPTGCSSSANGIS
jgi:transposase